MREKSHSDFKSTLKDAFSKDLEIIFGYVTMGFCAGLLLSSGGFSAIYTAFLSIFVYSGVMQFLALDFFSDAYYTSAIGLLNIFLITLILNARQGFYTLIMLEIYRKMDWKKFLNIFWLTDETFALLKTKKPQNAKNLHLFIFFVSLFNYLAWAFGSVCGAILGVIIGTNLDTRGLDFIMSAIFVVILIDQIRALRAFKEFVPIALGAFSAIVWLFLVGEKYFILLAILSSIAILALLRKFLE